MIEIRKNQKYPNVPLFYSNTEDREKWEGCQLYLKSKFCQNAILYTYEQDKIAYIRDYCGAGFFRLSKLKVNPKFANEYLNFSKMIQDLKNILSEFNEIGK